MTWKVNVAFEPPAMLGLLILTHLILETAILTFVFTKFAERYAWPGDAFVEYWLVHPAGAVRLLVLKTVFGGILQAKLAQFAAVPMFEQKTVTVSVEPGTGLLGLPFRAETADCLAPRIGEVTLPMKKSLESSG
jgi:hypothetical protein